MLSAVFMYCVTSGASGTTCAENATEERRQCHSLYSSTVSPSKLQHYELQKKKGSQKRIYAGYHTYATGALPRHGVVKPSMGSVPITWT
jgi:hypothetical protein